MENENQTKTSNKKGISVGIFIIFILLALVAGWFLGGKFSNTTKTADNEVESSEEITTKDDNKELDNEITIEKGACPLTKFDQEYVLSDEEKEEILTVLKSKGIEPIGELSFIPTPDSNYSMNVSWKDAGSGSFASIAKVNDEFKILMTGSGDTTEGRERMIQTLNSICE